MARKKQGLQTVSFEKKPYIIGRGNVVGKKESEGPLASYFDESLTDDMYGEKSWEKAESRDAPDRDEQGLHQSAAQQRKHRCHAERGFGQSDHVLVIYGKKHAHSLPGPLRSLLDNDRIHGARLNADRRRVCIACACGGVQPFLHGGETIPNAG